MDLFCPHCTRRVTVPDDKAGQAMNCPLCTKQFMAPSLAPPPVAPKPPAPPSAPAETYGMGEAPAPSPGAAPKPAPASTPMAPVPVSPPSPPPPPGEYTRSSTFHLSGAWLAFLPPACAFLIFVLSFFTWHSPVAESIPALSLWGLSFTEKGQGQFLAYTILMFPAIVLTFAALPFDKGWVPAPPPLAPLMSFKNLIVGLLLGVAFLLLCYDYLDGNLLQKSNPIAWPMKLAIRLHFAAVFASFLMFWLNWRKQNNLPAPKCEARW